MHWAVDELRRIMPPPPDGGDEVDWDFVRTEFGWTLPADYRDFVAVYGMGAVSDSLSISTPPFPGYPYGDHLLLGSQYPPSDDLLRWGTNEAGDDFFWRCGGEPDRWTVAVRTRFYGWRDCDLGMAEFLLRLLQGRSDIPLGAKVDIDPPFFESWREEERRLLEGDDSEGF
jgi:hypothetical protein